MNGKLEIRRLALTCSIGVYDWEKDLVQDVFVDIDLPMDVEKAAAADQLADTIDYSELVVCMEKVAQSQHFHLLETMALMLADALLTQFGLPEVRVCVDKPTAIPSAESTRICISRKA